MAFLADLTCADRHRVISAGFTEQAVAVADWSAPTPVAGWAARDVVAHLVGWITEFLGGGGVSLADGPPVDDDPVAAWIAHTEGIQAVLDGASAEDDFHHPMVGSHRLADAVDRFYTADVYMHTWDLAASNGRPSALEPEFAVHLLVGMADMEDLLRSSGQYGPAVEVDEAADPVSRLAGFIGRDPAWPTGG